MKIICLTSSCVAFTAEKNEYISENDAKALIDAEFEKRSIKKWSKINVDFFCCGGEKLYIARPEMRLEIRLAEYALPFLTEYFTE